MLPCIPRNPLYTASDPLYALSNPPYSLIDYNSEDPVDPLNHSISYDTLLDNHLVNNMDNGYEASGSQLSFEPDTESKYLPATVRQLDEGHAKLKTRQGQATVSSQRFQTRLSYNRRNKSVAESPDLSKHSPTIAVQLDKWLVQPRTWQHEETTSSRRLPEQVTLHNSRSPSATSSPELRKYLPYLPDTPAYAITDKEIADYLFQPASAGLISETQLDLEISQARRTLWRLARNLYNLPMPTQQDSYTPNQSCETWATHLFELLDIVTTFRPTCVITNKLIPAQDIHYWPKYGELHIAYNSLVAKTIRKSNELDLLLLTPEWLASKCLFDACAFKVAAVSFRDQMEQSIQRLHDILTKSITVQDLPHKSSTNHLPATNHPQGDPQPMEHLDQHTSPSANIKYMYASAGSTINNLETVKGTQSNHLTMSLSSYSLLNNSQPSTPLDLEDVSVSTPTFTLEGDNSSTLPIWKSVSKLLPILDHKIPIEAVKDIASNEQLSDLLVNKLAQPLVTIKKRNGITSGKESLAKSVKQSDNESMLMTRDQFRSTTPLLDEALCDLVHINSHHSVGNLSQLHALVTTSTANGITKHTGTPSNLTSHGPTSTDTHISNTHDKRTIINKLNYKEATPKPISGLLTSQASHSPDEFHVATIPSSSMNQTSNRRFA
ncbi:Retrovirus-related Pol polyprotein from transposon [Rhizoctonia solani]|uniref:Retrovirus-related Pol polyprotein from transposon n=1 Tax=Rhizoctonia solani TaxID=456999 RepID=A0A8H8SUM4_9AGAM|nr:Retrovirus-related Pol polyprotein from transposon [Rhizoctonia solani]QRW17547.1 Retrovirus-related Pol polyprotein from transposon [Rhizoctonia solani]